MEKSSMYLLLATIICIVSFICFYIILIVKAKKEEIQKQLKDNRLSKRNLCIACLSGGLCLACILLIPISLVAGGKWLVDYEYKARAMENVMTRIAANSEMLSLELESEGVDPDMLFSCYRQSIENISCKDCPKPFVDALAQYKISLGNLEQTMRLSMVGWKNKIKNGFDRVFNDGKKFHEKKNTLESLLNDLIDKLGSLRQVYLENQSFLHWFDPLQHGLSGIPQEVAIEML